MEDASAAGQEKEDAAQGENSDRRFRNPEIAQRCCKTLHFTKHGAGQLCFIVSIAVYVFFSFQAGQINVAVEKLILILVVVDNNL